MHVNEKVIAIVKFLINGHPQLLPEFRSMLEQCSQNNPWARFNNHREEFLRLGGSISSILPVLSDFDTNAGDASGHYFHQDLLVASLISIRKPMKHVDIGSRIDGFVAHVASFRPITVFDIRPLQQVPHENINFIQCDIETIPESFETDSLSCLHAIEHFGLGRYGDKVDPNGHLKAFKKLSKIVQSGGFLYISFPIGIDNQVCFNAHRIFHPLEIFNWISKEADFEMDRFDFVDDYGRLHRNVNLVSTPPVVKHGCGIYSLRKI
jgi:hypothetical protein